MKIKIYVLLISLACAEFDNYKHDDDGRLVEVFDEFWHDISKSLDKLSNNETI